MKFLMKKSYLPLLAVILLSIIPLFDLLNPGLPITHDGQDHVVRIANFYQNLQEGILIPRWGENLNWGYGHPVMMFLYPLPSYFASIFHFFGFSFVDSLKLVFGASFILSGLTMYLWLRAFLSTPAAITGSVLYLYAPYRFVDLYVRGAIGEHVAFIFPPLVLYFLFRLSQKHNYWNLTGGALSLAGLILAHNAISLMFLPFILGYAIFLYFQTKSKKSFILYSLFFILMGFSISAFFWLPAFMEGKYTLRDIVTKGTVLSRFVSFSQLVYGPWNYGQTGQFTVQVGISQWIAVLVSLYAVFHFWKRKSKYWIVFAALFGLFIITLFLMTPASKFIWEKVSLLQKFQFPWRLLSLTIFVTAVLGALSFEVIKKRYQPFFLAGMIVLSLLSTYTYWHAKAYIQKPDTFYSGVYKGTTDTGESSPIWSIRFMEHMPVAPMELIEGKVAIIEKERSITNHQYILEVRKRSLIRENTLYFPGWHVYIDGQETPIEFQDSNNRGLMTFWIDEGRHEVSVKFTETKLRLFANTFSLLAFLGLIVVGVLSRYKIIKRTR